MAYFYQHIKGLTGQATNWKIDCEAVDYTPTAVTMNSPLITFTVLSTTTDLGHIITSKLLYPRIENFLYLNNGIILSNGSDSDQSSYAGKFFKDNNGLHIWGTNGQRIDMKYSNPTAFVRASNSTLFYSQSDFSENPISLYLRDSGSNYKGLALTCFEDNSNTYTSSSNINQSKILANCPLYIHDYIRVRKNSSNANGYIDVDSYVQALYFNATSDKRAKTNINQSTFSALNIIKSLPIYNFKYKSDGSDSIGIIAQEALKVNAGNFSLVTNVQASGENGNYMSVRESKLVYIAWKAIQEQQEIINKQSKEIEELKQLVKTLIEK